MEVLGLEGIVGKADSKEGEMEVWGWEGKMVKEIVICNREVEGLDVKVGRESVVYNGELESLETKFPKDTMVYNGEVGGLEGKVGKKIVVHTEHKSQSRNFFGLSACKNQFESEDVGLESAVDRVIVLGLMAASNCPQRQGKMGNAIVDLSGEVGGLKRKLPKDTAVYNGEVGGLKGKVGKDIAVHTEGKCLKGKVSVLSASKNHYQSEDVGLESAMDRVIVQGLMASPSCPRSQGIKPNPADVMQGNEGKKQGLSRQEKSRYFFRARKIGTENLGSEYMKNKSPSTGKAACQGMHERIVRDGVDSLEHDEEHEKFHVGRSSHDFDAFRVKKAGTENLGGEYMKNKSPSTGKATGQGSKGKKYDLSRQDQSKYFFRVRKVSTGNQGGVYMKNKLPSTGKAACQGMLEQVVRDDVDSLELDEEHEDFRVGHRSLDFDASLPLLGPSSSSGKGGDHDAIITSNTRKKVRETLCLFQTFRRKLLLVEAAKSKKERDASRMANLQAARILEDKGKYVNRRKQILGPVPGVEVGDGFHYRAELATIGLHCQFQAGIDYVEQGGKVLAISVVSFGNYANEMDNSDELIFTGTGRNVIGGDKQDQKLERGNLALKNSIRARNPVRVIRGFKGTIYRGGERVRRYMYDGLYLVKKYWQDVGPRGNLVFKFRLVRILGQPELALSEVKESKKFKTRKGLCVDDISQGKEFIPICVVNTIDGEKPPPFNYITHMMYPNWYHPTPHKGCDCTNGCSDSEKCSCAVKNGGEIPYNYYGAIVEAKPLVYECGPSCKCSSSCHNRVSQHGINFQLEIFKTESRGWGVRSLNSIPSGSFICELLGELLQDEEAEQRTGNDEYLFDIGQNYNDHTLWDGLSNVMLDAQSSSCEVVEDSGFTIDAAKYGNVARFINHSCSPNLYAQNVLYDHEDKRMPHIMLFATEDIPPLQELTYHYNYTIDQVRDSNGNIKKKSCYCGTHECTGRMY